jgi:hypothetical protein
VTFTPTDATNYNTVIGSANVTVNKATPTVSAWPTASSITYGQTLASSTLSGGTTTVAGSFAFTTPATAPNAGTASQSVTFTPTSIANYNTVSGGANVTVTKATLTVTANNRTKTYGQTLTFAGTEFTTSGLASGDTVTGVNLTSAGTGTSAAAVPYGITPSAAVFGSGSASNYTIGYNSGTLTVSKAVLTVTAQDAGKAYGSVNPALSVSYSGFQNGDLAPSLTTQPTASTTATMSSPAGTYTITAGGGVSSNYTFNYVNGTLTVNAAALTVTANA